MVQMTVVEMPFHVTSVFTDSLVQRGIEVWNYITAHQTVGGNPLREPPQTPVIIIEVEQRGHLIIGRNWQPNMNMKCKFSVDL